MEAVWTLEIVWPTSPEVAGLAGLVRNRFAGLVRDLGGAPTSEGRALFRRYRPAEICAHMLSVELGQTPTVTVSLR